MTNTSKSYIPIHGGNIEEQARHLGVNEENIIDASASIIPFKPPAKLINYLIQQIKNSSFKYYPDRDHFRLRKAIGYWHGIDPSMVFPGNGAAELLTWIAKDAQSHGLNALPSPCFLEYERALNCWNGNYFHEPLPLNWESEMPQNFPLEPNADVIWITNPHNPTGQLWSRNSIEKLLTNYRLVICDEAFITLVPDGEKQSVLLLTEKYENLIVIRSLTKLYGIAGLRLGYAISKPDRLNKWKKIRDPWPLNSLAISTGKMLMENKDLQLSWIKKIHMWIRKEGFWFNNELNQFNEFKVHPTSTNFQLIESDFSLVEINNQLASMGILLRDCRSFKNLGDNWLRISLQNRSKNKKLIKSMKKIIK